MIIVTWGNRKETYLVVNICEEWTAREIRQAGQRVEKLMQTKSYPVHTVVNLLNAGHPPETLVPLAYQMLRAYPNDGRQVAVVSQNKLWYQLAKIMQSIYPPLRIPLQFTYTMDEAIQSLNPPSYA